MRKKKEKVSTGTVTLAASTIAVVTPTLFGVVGWGAQRVLDPYLLEKGSPFAGASLFTGIGVLIGLLVAAFMLRELPAAATESNRS